VLLTATPVNNSLIDLETLVKYFIRDDARFAAIGIPSIRQYIKHAQKLDPDALTPGHLFDLMDQVAVRRTRRFVKENYRGETVPGPGGRKIPVEFPDAKVRRIDYVLDDEGEALVSAVTYALDIPDDEKHAASFEVRRGDSARLLLSRYAPSAYLKSAKLNGTQVSNMGLLRSALLKRLESSPTALAGTLEVLTSTHEAFLSALAKGHVLIGGALRDYVNSESEDLEEIIGGLDSDAEYQAMPAAMFHADLLRSDVELDLQLIQQLRGIALTAALEGEPKVARLLDELAIIAAAAQAVSPRGISSADRRKVIVFSTYADTIRDLHARLSKSLEAAADGSPLSTYRGRLAPAIIGEYASGKTGGIHQVARANLVAEFAPRTAGRLDDDGHPLDIDKFDILLTTDVLAEGVNLQQAAEIINYDLPWNPMRIVQRHGRVDRIGSEHPEIHLGVFFPSEHLDQFLKLENTLIRKLKQADAAVGTGTVLPGVSAFAPQDHFDADALVEEIEALVESGGGSAAGSGEEYRRRLANALDGEKGLKEHLDDLPHGVGSGFEHPGVEGNVFVFCMRMGDSGRVWFRNVLADRYWNTLPDEQGQWSVTDDTLVSLVSADPGGAERIRSLPNAAFSAAYEAWAVARDHAHDAWMKSTDPNVLTGALPLAFREAAQLAIEHGGSLGGTEQGELVRRLKSVPTTKAARAMRRALRVTGSIAERIAAIIAVLDEYGIQPASKVQPLPVIEPEDVRLIAWMAVTGTRSSGK
jgi:hypothetical protein